MFEVMEQPTGNPSSVDVARELERFKRDTGVDFFDLLKDKQLRAKVRVNDAKKTDTDEDTMELQQIYEPWQRRLFQDNDQ